MKDKYKYNNILLTLKNPLQIIFENLYSEFIILLISFNIKFYLSTLSPTLPGKIIIKSLHGKQKVNFKNNIEEFEIWILMNSFYNFHIVRQEMNSFSIILSTSNIRTFRLKYIEHYSNLERSERKTLKITFLGSLLCCMRSWWDSFESEYCVGN